MVIRRKFTLLVAILSVLTLIIAGCGGGSSDSSGDGGGSGGGSGELNLFIWSEYMPESVIQKFEEETGIKVNYNYYSSNEEMLAKISAGASGFDIAVASDYMVEVMQQQELLEEINRDNIPNIENLGEEFLYPDYDPEGKYSVIYMWGNVIIAVNEDKVTKEIDSYEDLWDPEFENSLVVLDDQRVLIGIANKIQGESMNATDPAVLEKSKELLRELLPNVKAFDSDSPKTLLVNGEAVAGIVWGGEAYLAEKENSAIKTVIPSEGTNLWYDNFVIPKGASNKENAEKFIDFVLRPEISAEITADFPYANPNVAAHELIDDDVLNHPAVYGTPELNERSEKFKDIGEAILEYDRVWSEVKQ